MIWTVVYTDSKARRVVTHHNNKAEALSRARMENPAVDIFAIIKGDVIEALTFEGKGANDVS